MGYNNDGARALVFDIETAPLDEAVNYIEPATAPANYRDPEKIAAYIEQANASAVGKCSLDPDLCRIVAIGDWLEGEAEPSADVVKGGDVDEASLLAAFWTRAETAHLIGFNCLAFDLLVLFRRSLYLGVTVPNLTIDRFKHPRVTDLMQVLSYNGTLKFRGLSFYCKRFGITVPDTITGEDIPQAVREGRWADVEAHVRADVRKTAALAARLGHFDIPEVAA